MGCLIDEDGYRRSAPRNGLGSPDRETPQKMRPADLVLDSLKEIRYDKSKVAKSSGQELKSRIALEAYAAFLFCRSGLSQVTEK